jgi:hypothetical protein
MDDNEFHPDRQTVNPARSRFLGSSVMPPYMEDKVRRTYKDVVLEMFGDIVDLDGEGRRIAIQHTADRLGSRLQGQGGEPITTDDVARIVERMRLPNHTVRDVPVELTREAYELVEEDHFASGDSRKAIASRYILAGRAAMARGFGETGDFSLH